MKIRSFFRNSRLIKDEAGSYSLEAALVAPISALLVAGVAFLLIASAQSSLTYITANESSERVSQHWNNSYKHPVTGMFSTFRHDPLFWRWNQDSSSAWLWGDEAGAAASHVRLPAGDSSGDSVLSRKLSGGAAGWPAAYRGAGSFRGIGWNRSVAVEAAVPLSLPGGFGLPSAAGGSSSKSIAEPAEFIRNVELALGYVPALKAVLEGDKVRNLVSPWVDKPDIVPDVDRTLSFRHHSDAVKYLRTLVRGHERRIGTEETGKWRLIDAMDKQEVAHQTYIGPKQPNKDVRDQLMKDAELIRKGKVKGVVWHFFRRTGDATAGPSPALKKLLQDNGIVFVIHS
ncbi:hypothetical protein [Paenibacillus sp.]|uniref:TadE/TadG family type IV pilus assembly protein n=1 Tax=Paenibacillus sp. TaxID=58172 RepID=UPI0028124C6D|nr:hypothetical protein [Paenibacillus sp.]